MKLVTVIPIARGVFKDTLTYFSAKDVLPGAIVAVSVRNRLINALVVSSEDLSASKTSVKNSPFALKKIELIKPNILFPEFVRAAEKSAKYFVAPIGNIIQTFIPKAVLDTPIPLALSKGHTKTTITPKFKNEKLVSQSEDGDRLAAYKSLVREEFARKASVFICFPTVEDVNSVATAFEKGIKEYTFVLHSGLAKKTMLLSWEKALKEPHPVVILGTASFLGIPRKDVKTIIVELENSRFYKTISRPEIDVRIFAEHYAQERGIKLIMGDIFLRPETLYRYHEHEFLPFISVKFHSLSTAAGAIVDMKKHQEKDFVKNTAKIAQIENAKTSKFTQHLLTQNAGTQDDAVFRATKLNTLQSRKGAGFTTLSNELKALVELTRREHGQLAILVGRRGLTSTTICNDCGMIVLCENCGAPLVLHLNKESRIFMCHKCGASRKIERDGEEKCSGCGSWRLVPLGIGIERVAEELRTEFPDIYLSILDSDTAKTEKVSKKIMADFYNTQGGVLLGTEMMINRLTRPVEASAIVGIDSFLTIPDFRINEKIFSLILSLRAKTQKTILLQTQNPEREFFGYALKGDLLSFYRQEIAERKMFGYPPFTTLIKISWDTKAERLEKETADLVGQFVGYDPRTYTSNPEGGRARIRAHALIKLPRGKWVDEKLLAVLKSLSPKYTVSVDPDSII